MKLRANYFVGVMILSLLLTASVFAHRNHSWGNYHWARTTNSFTLQLGDNVNDIWQPYLGQAHTDWSKSNVLDTVIVPGGTSPKRCAITSGRVEVCNERYGRTGWLGVAGISISNGHITGSYVKLNDSYTMETALKDLVTCQEVGHAFGLAHQDENFYNANLGTCMDYTNDADGGGSYGPANTAPNPHDYDQLVTIYNHLDKTTTVGMLATPMEIALGDYRSPRAWGKPVLFNREGQAIAFERDFGNGHKIITHIYPVPGVRRYEDEHDH
jgi:hypothetical protein